MDRRAPLAMFVLRHGLTLDIAFSPACGAPHTVEISVQTAQALTHAD